MRYLSWLLSTILHAALLVLFVYSVQLTPMFEPKILELDLAHIEPKPEITPLPKPPSAPVPEPEPVPQPLPQAPAALPLDKTVVLDDAPPPPVAKPERKTEPEPEPAPEPEPEPEAVPIEGEVEEEPEKPKVGTDLDKANVRRDHLTVHRGHEARFGRTLLADYYSYSSSEFSGQFTTREEDRTISIIDARDTEYGRFLIYDSKNKTLRRMKSFNKYVYTIGPSLYEDEPVTGTVTFLAKNDRIERFILVTDDDRIAHYPRKVHVREEDTTFPSGGFDIPCTTTLPPEGSRHTGLVFVHGDNCLEPGLIRGFTRALSARKLASLSFMPRGCANAPAAPGNDADLTKDSRAALRYFRKQAQVTHAGFWGNGPGAPTVLRAASGMTEPPAFVICELNDDVTPADMPGRNRLKAIDAPSLFIVTGSRTDTWSGYVATLESLRDSTGKPFSIIMAPLQASTDVSAARGDDSALVEQVTSDHAGLAASWIESVIR